MCLLAVCLSLLTACAGRQRATASAGEPQTVTINVKRLRAEDSWIVTYKLSQPTKTLIFDRQTNRFRREHWQVLTKGVSLALAGEDEALVSDTPFVEAEVRFKSYYEITPYDYEFAFKYSDGSLMLYTGHLSVENRDVTKFIFEGAPGDRVVILGKVYDSGRAEWQDEQARGTYVYFGKIRPTRGKRFTAVADPGLPPWLRTGALRMLPRLFDFYREKTGVALDFKPVIFFNFEPATNAGWAQTGGTLPGLMHLSIKGDPKTKASPAQTERLLLWVAHEAAHFWNSRMYSHSDGADWMHEGGADAFKYRALLGLGLITRAQFTDFHSVALNECIEGLQGISLADSHHERRFGNFYYCGAILALLTEHAVHAKTGMDLFGFWKELFARASREGGKRVYSEELYFKLVDELTGDATASKRLFHLVHGKSDDWLGEFHRTLAEAGLPAKLTDKPPSSEATQLFGRKAVREVMKADCDGRYGSTMGAGVYSTEGMEACKTFKSPMNIETIEGHDLFNAGHKAYDAVYEKCAAGGVVHVGAVAPTRQILEVHCSKPIAKRPPQLRLL